MMHRSFDALKRIDDTSERVESAERNAYLESFLLHYRNLLDFLVPRKKDNRDVQFDDFIFGRGSVSGPTEYRTDLDRRLAHVTYKRLEVHPDDKEWELTEMLRRIERTWKEFTDALAPEIRARLFGPQTEAEVRGIPHLVVSASSIVSASTSTTDVSVFVLPLD